jgi:hypothetical protein
MVHVEYLCNRVSEFHSAVRKALQNDGVSAAEKRINEAHGEFAKWCINNGLDVDFTNRDTKS